MQVVMADESGFAGTGYFAMAGYCAQAEIWPMFNRLWNAALQKHGIDHFHMKDFAGRRKAFTGWEEPRRQALMADLLRVITAGPVYAIGACLKISDFEKLKPEVRQGMIGPYIACFHELILGRRTCSFTSSGTSTISKTQDLT